MFVFLSNEILVVFFKFGLLIKNYLISKLVINAKSIINGKYIFMAFFINQSKFWGKIFKMQVKKNNLVQSL